MFDGSFKAENVVKVFEYLAVVRYNVVPVVRLWGVNLQMLDPPGQMFWKTKVCG
jgi:hypothetical protein